VSLETDLTAWRAAVDAALEVAFPLDEGTPPRLLEAMRYAVFSGGKRVRPVLTLAACEVVGGSRARAMPFACALELIHTYSLVHDDLPAMDDDDLRRGRPTVHVVYGPALAILAGDALLTEAFRLAAAGARQSGLDPARALAVVERIAAAAGAAGMVGGQVLDLEATGRVADLDLVESIHRHKTAALIAAAVEAGALAGGASDEQQRALGAYGQALGLAFQVADDLLDATAPTAVTGKRVGRDAEHGKATYPAVVGIEESRRIAAELLERCHGALRSFGPAGERLRALATFVVERAG
jgi:geranylgeranyl diphosphate synthase, type II